MPTVASLTAEFRADTSDIERGGQVARQTLQGVQQQAEVTARALEIMAQAASKANPGQGSPAQILEFFQRGNVQPTAAALTQARSEMEKISTAAVQAVQPTQAAARAAREHADAAVNGARAAQSVAEGWKLSESSMVRFGAGLAGIGLGFSLVTGAANLLHDTVMAIGGGILDWERSLVNLTGLYGEAGTRAAALAQAQSGLPNVLGTNQEFAQAAINASALTQRYGLPQQVTDQLTTTGGRVAFALGLTDPSARKALQAQLLSAVTSGGQIPELGIYTDPEAVARRLGAPGAQTLQAYTPEEILTARAAITSSQGNVFATQAEANSRRVLDTRRAAEKALEQAQSNITDVLENGARRDLNESPTADLAYQQAVGDEQLRQKRAALGLPEIAAPTLPSATASAPDTTAALQGNVEASLRELVTAQTAYAQTLADSDRAQESAHQTFDRLSRSVDAAGARLLGFTGSLEDQSSIGHGDILAQAQASVAARARSAVPLIGMGATETAALATGDAWQAVWQNFVASLAQAPQPNVIQRNLQQQADTSRFGGMSPDRQEARVAAAVAAQRALDQGPALDDIEVRIRNATRAGALVDMASAETQSGLQQITLGQRERQVQLLRDTVDLRRLDNQQQQVSLAADLGVVRATQAALPSQYQLADAQYQGSLASALARQRLGRTLRGQDVSGIPSIDDLMRMNVDAQFAAAEAGPGALQSARGVEMAQRTATSAGLAQQLTAGQLQSADLANDLKNLGDLPSQTALMLEDIQNGRDSLAVQKEQRDDIKKLVSIMTGRGGAATSGDQSIDEIANRVAGVIFGDDSSSGNVPLPDRAGNRRGPS